MYISYSREMTREFIDACAMWAKAFSTAAMAVDEWLFEDANPDDPTDTKQIQAFRIRFASGFEIMALSSARAACAASRAWSSSTRRPSSTT